MASSEDTIRDFNTIHGKSEDILFVRRMRERGLSPEQIVSVIECLDDLCQNCLDQEGKCWCWGDPAE